MTEDPDRAAKRAEVLRQVSDDMRERREALEDESLLSAFERQNTAKITEAFGIPAAYLRTVMPHDYTVPTFKELWSNVDRVFVCQGCGCVVTLLHGASMKCICGVTSSAELLPHE